MNTTEAVDASRLIRRPVNGSKFWYQFSPEAYALELREQGRVTGEDFISAKEEVFYREHLRHAIQDRIVNGVLTAVVVELPFVACRPPLLYATREECAGFIVLRATMASAQWVIDHLRDCPGMWGNAIGVMQSLT